MKGDPGISDFREGYSVSDKGIALFHFSIPTHIIHIFLGNVYIPPPIRCRLPVPNLFSNGGAPGRNQCSGGTIGDHYIDSAAHFAPGHPSGAAID